MTTLLTLQEAADILRISTDSMRRVSAGELPRFRVGPHGGRLKYRREDIDAYIESRREGEVPKIVRRRTGRIDGKPLQHL